MTGTSPHKEVVAAARSVAARAPIGAYDASAKIEDAPARFSATTLVVWAFAQVGIVLEDDVLVLHLAGEKIVGSEVLAADLVFRTGRNDRFHPGDLRYGVGLVGISTGEGTVVHASPFVGWAHEDLIDTYLDAAGGKYRGTRRIIAHPAR